MPDPFAKTYRNRFRLAGALLVALALGTPPSFPLQQCRGAVVCLGNSDGTGTGDAEVLAQQLEKVLNEANFSGAFLAMRNGKIILKKGFGYADVARNSPNTENELYDIASLSKSVTALAVLLLEHAGKLRTSDRIRDYLPQVPRNYESVTIHHLLTHTSGIPRSATASGTDLPKAVSDYLSLPPKFPPGKGFEYANGGYALLAAIVEKASEMRFEDYCRKNIFVPAGMMRSGFCGEVPNPNAVAYGFVSREGSYRPATPDPYPPSQEFGMEYKGMGGVLSSATDLLKLVNWIYGGGLPADVKSKFITPTEANPRYACGWEVFTFSDGTVCHGHGGTVAGFQSKLWWFPETKSLIIIISNRDDLSSSLYPTLKKTLFDQR